MHPNALLFISPSPATKPTYKLVIRQGRLLHMNANITISSYRQTVWAQIRLLLQEQSDLGPYYLLQKKFKRTSRQHNRRHLVAISSRGVKYRILLLSNAKTTGPSLNKIYSDIKTGLFCTTVIYMYSTAVDKR